MRCPGQDMRFWKPGDIFEIQCPKCGGKVEFFRDEIKRRCHCGHEIVNSKLDFGCAQWCPYAEQCVGSVPEEAKARQKMEEKNSLRERISMEMKKHFGKDFKRTNHALKVARYAEEILKVEGGDPLVVLGAAYLHDIGIPEAERRDGNSSGHPQKGAAVAKEILGGLSVQQKIVEEICDIIGQHHDRSRTGGKEETLNFQILYEADWLVNMEENGFSKDPRKVDEIIGKIFKTVTGKRLAKELPLHFLPSP